MRYLNFVLFSAERKLFSGLQNNFLVPSIAFGHSAKSVRKKDVRSIPALFKASIKKWCKLLDEEIRNDNEILKQLCAEDSGMQMLEKRGLGVTRLNVVGLNHDPMDGMTLLLSRQSPFWSPQKWLRPGSPAVLNIVNGSSLNEVVDCVIRKATSAQIEVKVDDSDFFVDDLSEIRRLTQLVLAPSQTKGALHSLQNFLESKEVYTGAGSRLIDYAFRGAHMPSFHERRLSNLDTDFNESQVRAISASMNSKRPFLCIQGPPGTGKTKVISKITQMLIEKGKKVLLCAPSNVATDNVYDSTLSLISKGSPKRISEIFNVANQREAVCEDPEFGTLQELSNQLKSASSKEKAELIKRMRALRMNIVRNVYLRRKAVFCTLSSSAIRFLPRLNWHADVLIIDEAAQCTEPAVWAAIVGTKRCILVGDPAQLPAVVKSDKAISSGLQVSLMERLMKEFSNGNVGIMLDEQYRSNDAIVRWSSESFYDAKLRSHESVANQRLSDRYFVDKDSILDSPILLINTDFKSNRSREQFSHRSCYNRDEVEVIVKYVNLLLRANVPPQDIAVIAPYFAQVEELRKAIKNESVAVNSVDAFQGQEREVVIFSTVRDNKQGYLGFLREERRLNVAITRAKRQFVMIGSVKTICSDENLSSFYRYLLERKSVYDPAEVFASFF